ncbi:hypothetical protein [Nocardioides sp. YIM 152588]|uniref:hypothetical protein n=1 Tax=Nocardioides sp. YIM 152588 TaxID=3158259 RepID=UPI0032E40F93
MGGGRRRAERSRDRSPAVPVGRVLLAVVAIVAAVAGASFWVVTSDVDLPALPGQRSDPSSYGAGSTSSPGSTGATEETSTPPTPAEAYAALAKDLGPLTGECREQRKVAADPNSGVLGQLRCPVRGGTLVLTTYATTGDLDAVREGVQEPSVGSLASTDRAGIFHSVDPAVAGAADRATVYWDDRKALQSARVTGDAGTALAALTRTLDRVRPSVTAPTAPAAPALVELAAVFALKGCARVPVRWAGETEESTCSYRGARVRIGQFATGTRLGALRGEAAAAAGAAEDGLSDFWFYDLNGEDGRQDDEPEQGKVFGYPAAGDATSLWVDDTACRCWITFTQSGVDDPRTLYDRIF